MSITDIIIIIIIIKTGFEFIRKVQRKTVIICALGIQARINVGLMIILLCLLFIAHEFLRSIRQPRYLPTE